MKPLVVTLNTSKGHKILIDKEDYDLVKGYTWYVNNYGYVVANHNNSTISLSRLIMNAPRGKQVDHRSGNKLDNRKLNLRLCTQHQNLMGKHKKGFKGVRKERSGKFAAIIRFKKKDYWLGSFKAKVQAALAYNDAAMHFFGAYAVLNKTIPIRREI